jgi:hypothetical protein
LTALAACVDLPVIFQATFTHSCKQQQDMVRLDWLKIRFADPHEAM